MGVKSNARQKTRNVVHCSVVLLNTRRTLRQTNKAINKNKIPKNNANTPRCWNTVVGSSTVELPRTVAGSRNTINNIENRRVLHMFLFLLFFETFEGEVSVCVRKKK